MERRNGRDRCRLRHSPTIRNEHIQYRTMLCLQKHLSLCSAMSYLYQEVPDDASRQEKARKYSDTSLSLPYRGETADYDIQAKKLSLSSYIISGKKVWCDDFHSNIQFYFRLCVRSYLQVLPQAV